MKNSRNSLLAGSVAFALASMASTAHADPDELETIVVTAEHRTESVQKVPISIAVVDLGETQKLGITDTTQLSLTVPSLSISHQLNAQSVFLRGVGTIANPGNEGAVATYIDGVYITGYGATLSSLTDINRVEVLKGPQGTLFGRNATGGVISIYTQDPTQADKLDAHAAYSNYNTWSGDVFATGGLTSDLAGSISLSGRDQESGWGHNFTTGQKTGYGKEYNTRAKLLWTPEENTSVHFNVDRSWDDYDYGLNPAVLPDTITAGLGTYQGRYNSVGFNSQSNGGADAHNQYAEGASLGIDHTLPWMVITSITAYRQYAENFWFDEDMGPVNVVSPYFMDTVKQWTQEFRFASLDGSQLFGRSWKWMLGAFYLHKEEGVNPLALAGEAAGGLESIGIYHAATTGSYAGFIDTTYEFLPQTNLTLGARYTSERTTDVSRTDLVGPPTTVVPSPTLSTYSAKPTYRIVLDHSFDSDVMAYISQSRGFKSGGFALLNGAGSPPVKPEILDATEVGIKSQWLDRRLQVNAEAFNYDYSNLQISQFAEGGSIFVNAAKAKIRGLDLDLLAEPVEHLTLHGSMSYLHGRYESFPGAPEYLRNPATCNAAADTGGVTLPGPATPGVTVCGFDAAGKPTVRSPEWVESVGGDYAMPVSYGVVDLAANLYHTSAFNWDPDGLHPEHAYALVNASLTWTAPSKRWDMQLFCDNCANKAYDSEEFGVSLGIGVSPGNPATYGFRVGVHLE
jgi:iron complex outermembrane receptor protein